MKFVLNKNDHKIVIETLHPNFNDYTFLFSYGAMIEEYFDLIEKSRVKNFLEYLQEKTKDPFLNNLLLEEIDFTILSNDTIEDKEGIWKIYYKMEEESLIIYFSGYYLWIEDKKNNKKYFYYTD